MLLNGVNLEVIWFDQDMIEIALRCSNGYFAGTSEIYVSHDGLSELADALRGFPSGVSDIRTVELGTFNPSHADGGLKIHFYCTDSSGHAVAEVKPRGGGCKAFGEIESVALACASNPLVSTLLCCSLKRSMPPLVPAPSCRWQLDSTRRRIGCGKRDGRRLAVVTRPYRRMNNGPTDLSGYCCSTEMQLSAISAHRVSQTASMSGSFIALRRSLQFAD